jgi:hypothetical protein
MMSATTKTGIVYSLCSDTEMQDDDGREEKPEIHMSGWSGTRGHVDEDDCDDLDYNLHEALWTTYGDGRIG